jgi:hypothetical protein
VKLGLSKGITDFENKLLREKVTRWTNGENYVEELHVLYPSPNIIRVIKSMKQARHGEDDKCIQYFSWKTSK